MAQVEHLHFWLRCETKPGERRTPLMPEQCAKLLKLGHKVTVEKYATRCVADNDYEAVKGVEMVEPNAWKHAPKEAIIMGLKELPEETTPLVHRHIFFAHCYKNQAGWEDILRRFVSGGGSLYDLEFLTYEDGRRIAAFGKSAGYIGMGTGLRVWAEQQADMKALCPPLQYADNYKEYTSRLRTRMQQTGKGRLPKVFVMGALGRCGGGAVQCALDAGIPPENITKWDMAETKKGGPFREILDADVFINCIYLSQKIPPFLNEELVRQPGRKLSAVVDVSCDLSNPNNPILLPNYTRLTHFENPVIRCIEPSGTTPALDVVSIDHLPTLVPFESAREYTEQLFPHIVDFGKTSVWTRANELFMKKTAHLRGPAAAAAPAAVPKAGK